MGLMRWLRGGEENSGAAGVISAGMAEIDGLFRPSRHKQTEHVESQKRKRIDVSHSGGVDLDGGRAVIRARRTPEDQAAAEPPTST